MYVKLWVYERTYDIGEHPSVVPRFFLNKDTKKYYFYLPQLSLYPNITVHIKMAQPPITNTIKHHTIKQSSLQLRLLTP